MSVLKDIAGIFADTTSDAFDKAKNLFSTNGSIMTLISPFIIEPTFFITNNVRNKMPEVMHKAIKDQVDLFTAFYTQAFKVLADPDTSNTMALKLLKTSSYNYNVGELGMATGAKIMGKALEDYGVASRDDVLSRFFNSPFLSSTLESYNFAQEDSKDKGKGLDDKAIQGYHIRAFEVETPKDIMAANGAMTRVTIKIPLIVKANIVFVDTEDLLNAMEPKTKDKTLWSRWHQWRSKTISFWNLITGNDLIREYKKTKMKDKNQVLDILHSKEVGSFSTGFFGDGRKGYEKFFNWYIITYADQEKFEKQIRGKLDNPSVKDKFCETLNAMGIFSLDEDEEMGNLYLHTLANGCVIPFKNIGKRKDNTDLTSILTSLFSNRPPVF